MGTLGGRPGLVQRVGRWLGALEEGLGQVQVEGCSAAASCLPRNERGRKRRGKREETPRVCVKAPPTSQGGPKHAVRATKDIWAPANLTI